MNYETFVSDMKEHIKEHLPENYADAKVEVFEQNKLNESYLGLRVTLPDQRVAPCINLDAMYDAYADGTDIRNIISKTVSLITAPVPDMDLSQLRDYDAVKDRLFIKVSNAEKNAKVLAGMPHTMMEDMAITYHVMVGYSKEQGLASFTMNNEYLDFYGISQEQLHIDAMNSTQKIMPFEMVSIEDVMSNGMRERMEEAGFPEEEIQNVLEKNSMEGNIGMWVVSNEIKTSGAATIFYPDVMDKIAEQLDGSFFVIPSSTEEVLVVPDKGNADYRELNDMVCEVNDTQVMEQEQLGSQVYHYDAKEKVFEKASSYEDRQAEKLAGKNKGKEKASVLQKIDEKKRDVTDAVKDAVAVKRVAGTEL